MNKLVNIIKTAFFMLLLSVTAGVFATSTASAQGIPTSCHGFGASRLGVETYQGETYSYSGVFTNPSWSGCNDINVSWIDNMESPPESPFNYTLESCANFRVRFYPSSGGSYANGWKQVCQDVNSNFSSVIATAVNNNTHYRIETWTSINFSYSVWD